MIKPQSGRWISLSVIACSLIVVLALSIAIGKLQFGVHERIVHARFGSVTGINVNTPVKYAGAKVGRVKKISIIPRSQVNKDSVVPAYIQMDVAVDSSLELGSDVEISVKQDGLLGAKYVALTPGALDSPVLAKDAILEGTAPTDISDLAGPAKTLITELQPTAKNLKLITATLNEKMPVLLAKLDSVLANGDNLMATVGSPEAKEKIRKMLINLKVVSDNLKVVTTNAKAMTGTLGERPWSLLWGGEKNELPSEEEILASDKSVPIVKKVPKEEEPKESNTFKAKKKAR